MNNQTGSGTGNRSTRKRTRLVRSYPTHALEDTLCIAEAIQEFSSGLPYERESLARRIGTTPSSSSFTMRLNSSSRYGLTEGGYNDDTIKLLPLGEAIVAPKSSDERAASLLDAAVAPEVFGRFYRLLNGRRLPENEYAENLLRRDLGLQRELTGECLEIIISNGLFVGIINAQDEHYEIELPSASEQSPERAIAVDTSTLVSQPDGNVDPGRSHTSESGRIFVGHCGHEDLANEVCQLLDQFGIASIAWDSSQHSDDWPVPKAMSEAMRSCNSAVIVLAQGDQQYSDSESQIQWALVQIGAASAFFGSRLILMRDSEVGFTFIAGDLPIVEFDKADPSRAGLDLLKELTGVGAIRITA